jgi:ATP-dependent RNA helicase DDX60
VLINTFPTLESEEFKEYLHVTPVHFVMMHDGSSRSTNTSAENSEDEKLAKVLLRGMIWWWNTHRLNVALINRIEFRDSKVFTMIVESFTTSSKMKLLMTAKFVDEIKETTKLLKKLRTTDEEVLQVRAEDLEELAKNSSVQNGSESYNLAAYGVSATLRNKDCDVFMASAFVLHR